MFDFCRYLVQKANIPVQKVLDLQKNWSEFVFQKKSWICCGKCNLPHKTLKFKVSMFSLIFAFCRFWHKKQTYWLKQF